MPPVPPCGVTGVVCVTLLFAELGSLVVAETPIVLEMVDPPAVVALTLTTSVKVCGPLPTDRVVILLLKPPVPPGAGTALFQPAGPVSETNVVLAGTFPVSDTLCASL